MLLKRREEKLQYVSKAFEVLSVGGTQHLSILSYVISSKACCSRVSIMQQP